VLPARERILWGRARSLIRANTGAAPSRVWRESPLRCWHQPDRAHEVSNRTVVARIFNAHPHFQLVLVAETAVDAIVDLRLTEYC